MISFSLISFTSLHFYFSVPNSSALVHFKEPTIKINHLTRRLIKHIKVVSDSKISESKSFDERHHPITCDDRKFEWNYHISYFIPNPIISYSDNQKQISNLPLKAKTLLSPSNSSKFSTITPKVSYAPTALNVAEAESINATRIHTPYLLKKPSKTKETYAFWEKLHYVSIINLVYTNGDIGQLYIDLSHTHDKDNRDTAEKLTLICFEDFSDTYGLIDVLSRSYRYIIQQVLVSPIILKEALSLSAKMGLEIFVLRKGEIEAELDWTLDDYNKCVIQIFETRKSTIESNHKYLSRT